MYLKTTELSKFRTGTDRASARSITGLAVAFWKVSGTPLPRVKRQLGVDQQPSAQRLPFGAGRLYPEHETYLLAFPEGFRAPMCCGGT